MIPFLLRCLADRLDPQPVEPEPYTIDEVTIADLPVGSILILDDELSDVTPDDACHETWH